MMMELSQDLQSDHDMSGGGRRGGSDQIHPSTGGECLDVAQLVHAVDFHSTEVANSMSPAAFLMFGTCPET